MADIIITGPGWYVREDGIAVQLVPHGDGWAVVGHCGTTYDANGKESGGRHCLVRRLNVIGELSPLVQEWVREVGDCEDMSRRLRAVRDLLLPLVPPPKPVVEWRLVTDGDSNDVWHGYVDQSFEVMAYQALEGNAVRWRHTASPSECFDSAEGLKAAVEKRLTQNGGAA